MQLYALKIRKADLALITLLNGGVTPLIEKTPTYFVFDATWNTEFANQIVTERELYRTYEMKKYGPMLYALKK